MLQEWHSFSLGPLPHGDMAVPIWHTMAKKAKFGRNGPHSRFHISMATARILPTKDAIDTRDSGPNICNLPTLVVAPSNFPPWRENDTQMGQNGNIPQIGQLTILPSQGEATWGTPHSTRVYVPSPNRPCPWSSGARNPGPNIKGETGYVAILGKTAKIHKKKWSLEKLYLRIPREIGLGLLHACKPNLCFPFATKVGVQSVRETFLIPQSLKHTIYGKKCIYRRYWQAYIYGSLKNKSMSKHFWSRPMVSAFKYAHYG